MALLTKYYSGDHVEGNKMGGPCCLCRGMRNEYKVFVGKHEGKRRLPKTND
jgi:hypothetical protein